jgi:hypothetical protein
MATNPPARAVASKTNVGCCSPSPNVSVSRQLPAEGEPAGDSSGVAGADGTAEGAAPPAGEALTDGSSEPEGSVPLLGGSRREQLTAAATAITASAARPRVQAVRGPRG